MMFLVLSKGVGEAHGLDGDPLTLVKLSEDSQFPAAFLLLLWAVHAIIR